MTRCVLFRLRNTSRNYPACECHALECVWLLRQRLELPELSSVCAVVETSPGCAATYEVVRLPLSARCLAPLCRAKMRWLLRYVPCAPYRCCFLCLGWIFPGSSWSPARDTQADCRKMTAYSGSRRSPDAVASCIKSCAEIPMVEKHFDIRPTCSPWQGSP